MQSKKLNLPATQNSQQSTKGSQAKGTDASIYLDGIATGNPFVVNRLFKECLPVITHFVVSNSGNTEDAEDIFMDAMEVICRKVKSGDFVITCSFLTYFFEVCKRLWFRQLRRRKFRSGLTMDSPMILGLCVSGDPCVFDEKEALFLEKVEALPVEDRKVIQLYLDGKDMKEIASTLELSSEGHARKRKFDSKKRLTGLVQNDARFQELAA